MYVPRLCSEKTCTYDEYRLLPGTTPPLSEAPSPSPTPTYTVFNHTSNLALGEKLPPTSVIGGTTGSSATGYHITFLGNFTSWQGCRDNAAQRYRPLASGWTWFSAAADSAKALTCFAHRDGIWHPHADPDAVAGNSTGWKNPPPPPPPTPEPRDPLLSIGVSLNGSPLQLAPDGTPRPMRGVRVVAHENFTIAVQAKSVVFAVLPDAHAQACAELSQAH